MAGYFECLETFRTAHVYVLHPVVCQTSSCNTAAHDMQVKYELDMLRHWNGKGKLRCCKRSEKGLERLNGVLGE